VRSARHKEIPAWDEMDPALKPVLIREMDSAYLGRHDGGSARRRLPGLANADAGLALSLPQETSSPAGTQFPSSERATGIAR